MSFPSSWSFDGWVRNLPETHHSWPGPSPGPPSPAASPAGAGAGQGAGSALGADVAQGAKCSPSCSGQNWEVGADPRGPCPAPQLLSMLEKWGCPLPARTHRSGADREPSGVLEEGGEAGKHTAAREPPEALLQKN